jgi:hypothetical protein
MVTEKYFHIEMINPRSWSCTPEQGEIVAEFEAVCPETDNLILTIPLHEDFYDFAKEYCRQYKIHIENKLK